MPASAVCPQLWLSCTLFFTVFFVVFSQTEAGRRPSSHLAEARPVLLSFRSVCLEPFARCSFPSYPSFHRPVRRMTRPLARGCTVRLLTYGVLPYLCAVQLTTDCQSTRLLCLVFLNSLTFGKQTTLMRHCDSAPHVCKIRMSYL
jgi:hypothetical protein